MLEWVLIIHVAKFAWCTAALCPREVKTIPSGEGYYGQQFCQSAVDRLQYDKDVIKIYCEERKAKKK